MNTNDSESSTTLNTLSDRLLYALGTLKVTQAELARLIDVTPQAINYLCKSKARKSQLTYDIADALSINGEWLATGVGYMNPEDDPQQKLMNLHNRVPVVTGNQIKLVYQKQANSFSDKGTLDWLFTTAGTGENGFAIELQDKSMHPRFDLGTVVIINPDKKPHDNEFVLVYICATDDIILRQIEFHNKTTILKPMNTVMYKQLTLNKDDKIIGTLVEARWQT